MQAIEAPEVCPSCESSLEWKNDMLYCVMPLCPAQIPETNRAFCKDAEDQRAWPQEHRKVGYFLFSRLFII